jgi:hypothetical protein
VRGQSIMRVGMRVQRWAEAAGCRAARGTGALAPVHRARVPKKLRQCYGRCTHAVLMCAQLVKGSSNAACSLRNGKPLALFLSRPAALLGSSKAETNLDKSFKSFSHQAAGGGARAPAGYCRGARTGSPLRRLVCQRQVLLRPESWELVGLPPGSRCAAAAAASTACWW